jgi:Ca-activated chloride channel family protein
MRIMPAVTTVIVLAVAGLSPSAASAAGAVSAETSGMTSADAEPGKLLLMLDASGSMKAKDPSGLTKIEAAKKALTGVVGALPDTAQVGLRVYGATVDGKGKPTPAACADTQLVSPIGPLDKAGLTSSIAAIKALGETPIAHSLEQALKDLGADGKRNIVLVSDGEESCVPDPCPSVKKLTAAGVDLQIDTVGFGVNAKARTQLQCIADAGRGTYYDAKDAPALTASLSKLSQRALRPFSVSGTPVKGVFEGEDPPTLTPGQYTDAIVASEDRPLLYRFKRTIPGSTIHASIASMPRLVGRDTKAEAWSIQFREDNEDLGHCASDAAGQGRFTSLMTLAVLSEAGGVCPSTDPTVLLEVTRRWGEPGATPFEILFLEEPPVPSTAGLPEAFPGKHHDVPLRPNSDTPIPAVGGTSFSNALEIEPGTYVDNLVPGETTFFRVAMDYGQSLTYTLLGPPPSFTWPSKDTLIWVDGGVFGPDRNRANGADGSTRIGEGDKNAGVVKWVPPVAYLNRESIPYEGASMAGSYSLALSVSPDVAGPAPTGPVPVVFRVERQGAVTGKPTYAGTSPAATASPSASPTPDGTPDAQTASPTPVDDAGSGWLLWVGLGLVAALGALGAAYTVVRTRLRGNRTE